MEVAEERRGGRRKKMKEEVRKEKIVKEEKAETEECIYCKNVVEKEFLYGDGVCEECIKAGRPPFR